MKSSALLDTRVVYCGDNLEQLKKLPNEMRETARFFKADRAATMSLTVPGIDAAESLLWPPRMATDATFKSFEKELNRLVGIFERNLPELKSPDYVEAKLREDFLNPFFQALGWDM